ncbi:Holliday junction branch migration protein RuvA [Patulibacter defluvii]|uniref:Holliday junction branch migration protein RuvA n=1 Tax=Patulibacter defluvii TaxID=3095358 RepID=UPI002A75D9A3|nr:Holliday junction branch migration protein RuvA [Patulibacter sp. DM4]
MIALLRGTVHERRPDAVVLLTAGGVGYQLGCSTTTIAALPPVGSEVELLCHLAVREDAMTLYGFLDAAERDLFHLLVGVQAVGPKMALAVLSGGAPDEIAAGIAAGDAKRLQQAPGIGKRLAERIVAELQEKLAGHASLGRGATAPGVPGSPAGEAREGLLGLGLPLAEVDALLAVAQGETAAELIADALRRSRK